MKRMLTVAGRFLIAAFVLFAFCLMLSCSKEEESPLTKGEQPTPEPVKVRPEPVDPDKQPLFEKIYFKTAHDTWNEKFYYAVREGKIWVKEKKTGAKWQLMNGTGLPVISNEMISLEDVMDMANDQFGEIFTESVKNEIKKFYDSVVKKADTPAITVDSVAGLTVEYDNAVAVTPDGSFLHTTSILKAPDKIRWRTKWGWPFDMGPGMKLPPNQRSWTYSNESMSRNKFYRDPNGHIFPCMVSSVFALSEDGQHILFCDPWTTSDWGYQLEGPNRGAFVAEKMWASCSTVILINKYGDIYSMQSDFDIGGGNPGFMYTYEDNTCIANDKAGSEMLNLLCFRRIPDRWTKHPKISGDITDLITIIYPDDGVPGSSDRIIRVEGMDDLGNMGYFEKHLIDDDTWEFHAIPGWKNQGRWLDNRKDDCSTLPDVNKPLEEYNLDGNLVKGKTTLEARLENFSLIAEPADIKVKYNGTDWITFKLHHRFFLRTNARENPGMDGKYVTLAGQLEIPEDLMNNPDAREFLKNYLQADVENSKRFINVRVFPPFFHEEYGITTGIQAKPDSVIIKLEKNRVWKDKVAVPEMLCKPGLTCIPRIPPIPSGVELRFGAAVSE